MSTLPEGWVNAGLLDLATLHRGVTYSKADAREFAGDGYLPILRANNIQDRSFLLDDLVYVPRSLVSPSQLIQCGDVVVATSSGSINVVGKGAQATTNMDVGFGAFCGLLRPSVEVDRRYFGHYFSSNAYRTAVSSMARGVNINNLKRDHFSELSIALAPLNEQRRIADKLDATLARVDACRERLDRVAAILKRFRQSVLAAAVSGKLTEEWRHSNPSLKPWKASIENRNIPLPDGYKRLSKQTFNPVNIENNATELPNKWTILTIAELYRAKVLVDFADGNHGSLYPRKEDFGTAGALFLTATQIGEQWELDIEKCPRLSFEKSASLTKGWTRAGDVLLTHNATVGRVALLTPLDEEVLLGTSVTFYRFNPLYIEPRFARILFSSGFFQQQLRSEMEQTTRNQVPITKQISLGFICPPIEEQTEIVRRVESLFAFAARLEASLATGRAKVETLTPALLAKAFRGELVPQDPDDEPAEVLLERIRAERAADPGKAGRGRGAKTPVTETAAPERKARPHDSRTWQQGSLDM